MSQQEPILFIITCDLNSHGVAASVKHSRTSSAPIPSDLAHESFLS